MFIYYLEEIPSLKGRQNPLIPLPRKSSVSANGSPVMTYEVERVSLNTVILLGYYVPPPTVCGSNSGLYERKVYT
jgi:hypothetical protein